MNTDEARAGSRSGGELSVAWGTYLEAQATKPPNPPTPTNPQTPQNLNGSVRAFYSTPAAYAAARAEAFPGPWPLKTDDLFPYADCAHCYWTGGFDPGFDRRFDRLCGVGRQ